MVNCNPAPTDGGLAPDTADVWFCATAGRRISVRREEEEGNHVRCCGVCTAADECHQAGACDVATGDCSSPALPDGVSCSAGHCSAGLCVNDVTDADADADADGDAGTDAVIWGLRLRNAKTPSASNAAGEVGTITWDDSYVYVKTGPTQWKRAALTAW